MMLMLMCVYSSSSSLSSPAVSAQLSASSFLYVDHGSRIYMYSQLTSSQRALYPSLHTIPVLQQQQRELLGKRAALGGFLSIS